MLLTYLLNYLPSKTTGQATIATVVDFTSCFARYSWCRHGHGSSFRNPTQPNPSMKNIPLHTHVMSQHKILQRPLAENVKSN